MKDIPCKKVLMITPVFEPKQVQGKSEKMLTRVKEFAKNGWITIVLTFRRKGQEKTSTYWISGVPIKVYRFNMHFSYFFGLGKKINPKKKKDSYLKRSILHVLDVLKHGNVLKNVRAIFMYLVIPASAVAFGEKIIKKEQIDVIYASNMPNNILLLGALLKERTNTPYIAEFREPWTENTNFSSRADCTFERRVVNAADIVSTGKGGQITYEHFKRKHNLHKQKFFCLSYIGFLPEHYTHLKKINSNKFVIAYGGSMLGERNPLFFFTGVRKFINKNRIKSSDFEIVFMSDWRTEYQKAIQKLDLQESVTIKNYLPHDKYLSELNKASLLLLLVNSPGKKAELSVPSKTWEYIAIKKPILLLGKEHWLAAKFIKKHRIGVVAELDNPDSIAQKIEVVYRDYKKGRNSFRPSEALLKSLDRRKVIKQFCSWMDLLIKRRRKNKYDN